MLLEQCCHSDDVNQTPFTWYHLLIIGLSYCSKRPTTGYCFPEMVLLSNLPAAQPAPPRSIEAPPPPRLPRRPAPAPTLPAALPGAPHKSRARRGDGATAERLGKSCGCAGTSAGAGLRWSVVEKMVDST